MTVSEIAFREQEFIDEIAVFFESTGLPPSAGRILGLLLICDPVELSSAQLCGRLDTSPGAISTGTRMLVQNGLIDRFRQSGSRSMWFRVRDGAWADLFQLEVLRAGRLRRIAEHGLVLLADRTPQQRQRLEEFRDVNAFWERELPQLIEKWKKTRETK